LFFKGIIHDLIVSKYKLKLEYSLFIQILKNKRYISKKLHHLAIIIFYISTVV